MTQYTLDNPKLAETYDRVSDFQFKRGSQLVSQLGIRPDDVVLDIGSGTGRLGFHVLENRLGERGKLIGFEARRVSKIGRREKMGLHKRPLGTSGLEITTVGL